MFLLYWLGGSATLWITGALTERLASGDTSNLWSVWGRWIGLAGSAVFFGGVAFLFLVSRDGSCTRQTLNPLFNC